MPVSYARRKFANVLPLEDVVLPPPELDVVELLLSPPPPPPQPAATRARPAATAATGRSTFQRFLRVTACTSRSLGSIAREDYAVGRRSIVPSNPYAKLVQPV